MVPLDKGWYQRLLLLSSVIGVVGGGLAVIFMSITGMATDLLYGNTGIGLWAGHWWWIPLTALGGLLVAMLRNAWKISKEVPGAIALAESAWVDPSKAFYWVTISAVSLIMGASLGPSFGLAVMGGGFGSWLMKRLGSLYDKPKARQGFALTGMAGGMGGGYSAPLFATVLVSELSPTSKNNYVAALIPELFAATLGFVVYYGITGSSMLGSYRLPEYQLQLLDLLTGALLGVAAAFVLLLYTIISKLASRAAARIGNPYILGGVVFPAIFLGGTAGLLIHSLFPGIPIALCVGAMLAAVPGAFLKAPLALIIIAAGTIKLEPAALVPIGIAVVIAHMLMYAIRQALLKEHLPSSN